jgi:hypothetical protein
LGKVTDIPSGKYTGKRVGHPPKDEAEHFIRLPRLRRLN